MAALVFLPLLLLLLLLLSTASRSSGTWCVCKDGNSDSALQKTLDYACGAGADCNPIHQNGPCFNPNTVRAHCSYAVNSYFQKYRQQSQNACDFAGTAVLTNSDPSVTGCSYPATASGNTPVSTAPTTGGSTPTTTVTPNNGGGSSTGNGNNPLVTSPSGGGILGGSTNGFGGANSAGLGPTGVNNDFSHGWTLEVPALLCSFITLITFSALLFW